MRSVLWSVVGCACAGTVGAQSAPALHAAGYAPDWTLDIAQGQLTLATQLQLQTPPPKLVLPAPPPAPPPTSAASGTLRYSADTAQGELLATLTPLACTDPILGTLHPYSVEVRYAAARYQGCGGEPVALLQGRAWVVEDIAARAVLDRSRITLQFGADGTLSGRTACAPYVGSYQADGAALRLNAQVTPTTTPTTTRSTSPVSAPVTAGSAVPASAVKICAPALRRQDAAYFEVLNAISRWDFTADGALALGTVDGRRIVARRE